MSLELEDSLYAALSFLDGVGAARGRARRRVYRPLGISALIDEDSLSFSDLEELAQVNEDEQEAKPAAASAKSSKKEGMKRLPAAKPTPQTPFARARMRKEIVYLRNKVLEMERQLKQTGEDSGSISSVAAKYAARLLAARIGRPTVTTLTRGGRIRASSRPQFVWEEIASHKAERISKIPLQEE